MGDMGTPKLWINFTFDSFVYLSLQIVLSTLWDSTPFLGSDIGSILKYLTTQGLCATHWSFATFVPYERIGEYMDSMISAQLKNIQLLTISKDLVAHYSQPNRLSTGNVVYLLLGFHGGGGQGQFFFDTTREDKKLGVGKSSMCRFFWSLW